MSTVKRALLIGPSYASDLGGFSQLNGVQNDLRLMRDMLTRNGFNQENIMELEGDNASRDNILSTLDKLSSMAERRSVVVIYFSGHGYQLEEDLTDNKYFGQGILPADLTKETADKYHIYDVWITGEHFKPHLLKLIQKGCLVNTIFDCPYSGRMYRGFSNTPAVKQQPMEYGVCSASKHQHSRLKNQVQEFCTPLLSSQSWTPSDHDKFISIAACSSNEKAFEGIHPRTGVTCGCLTSVLVDVIDEAQREGKRISYNMLKSLIKRKFAERKWSHQQPQFESGDMNLVVFDFDTVNQPKAIEICEVENVQGFTKVVLNAGKLHGVVDGEYDVYGPDVTDDQVTPEGIDRYSLDRIVVNPGDVELLKSRGAALFKRDGTTDITVGCKAVLNLRHSMCTPVIVKLPTDFSLGKEDLHQMYLSIENQNMFAIEKEEKPDTVTLDVQIVEEKKCWRACQYGRMIVPYQGVGDEHLMMKNLSKYFRYKFAIQPKFSNKNMLENVSFKVFKIENVPSWKGAPDKKTELIAQATNTRDLYGELRPNQIPPTFRAHKVELVKSMSSNKKYKVVDGSGDAMVIQVTNNENQAIHVCVVSYQADGSIVALHPPKNGQTEVLRPGESMQTIRRVLLQPDTDRRMLEPDIDKPRPDVCTDVLILYVTTEQTNYEPLTQTAIELSPHLSTRGPDRPDGLRLDFANNFREALRPDGKYQCARNSEVKWLTIRRDIRVLPNQDPEPNIQNGGVVQKPLDEAPEILQKSLTQAT